MALKEYGFFPSSNGDRKYGADDFTQYFRDIYTDGILGNTTTNLQVTAGTGLKVSVASGTAYLNGHFYRPTAAKVLTLATADGTYARYDRVVIRCDYANRLVKAYVITGVPSASPVVPSIVRNSSYYDISLAYVYVAATATSLSAAVITDTRFDESVCGIVTGAIDTIETANLFAQYDAEWDLLISGFSGDEQAIVDAYNNINIIKPINVGGENILRNADFNGTSNWLSNTMSTPATLVASDGVLKVTPGTDLYSGAYQSASVCLTTSGKQHMLSVWLKADSARRVAIGFVWGGSYSTVNVTTDWQLFTVDLVSPSTTAKQLCFFSAASDTTPFYIKQPKLVEGNYITSGYAPSPLDNCKVDKLFDGTLTTSNANLTHPITNYDYIIASFCLGTGATVYNGTIMDSSANIAANYGNTYMADYSSSAARGKIIFVDANTVKSGNASQPTRILGIKCSLS